MTIHASIAQSDVRLVPLDVDYPVYRRRVIFQCYKWDPQVGDVCTIADQACVLSPEVSAHLSRLAELLAGETVAMEDALAERPDLWRELGLSSKLRAALRLRASGPEKSVRVMRFDFHPTQEGWALSEVNSDVPGGFAEAGALPGLASQFIPNARQGHDIGAAIVDAVSRKLDRGSRLAFVHATSYADDRQVMRFLANRFSAAGFECALVAPDHLHWDNGVARCIANDGRGAVDGLLRFFPADWLPALPSEANWRGYFESKILSCNPTHALLSQSKRLPLVWDRLSTSIPTWRSVLPQTGDTRDAPWRRDESWLVKPAFGRVGEGLAWRGGVAEKIWQRTLWKTRLRPRQWVAQRRFESRPLPSPAGPRHLCIGVFTVDGRAAGFYGRLSARATIEKHAQDVAILIAENGHVHDR